MTITNKPCPKCGEPLQTNRSDSVRTCKNGCEIYTAMPHGSKYYDQSVTPATDSEGNRVTGGGVNNLRRMPHISEE